MYPGPLYTGQYWNKKEQLFSELSIWNLETIAIIISAKVSNFARIAWDLGALFCPKFTGVPPFP